MKNYGLCPICGTAGVSRERRLNGNDTCENGHTYPTQSAVVAKHGDFGVVKITFRKDERDPMKDSVCEGVTVFAAHVHKIHVQRIVDQSLAAIEKVRNWKDATT